MSERILLLLMELFAIAARGSKEDELARRNMEEEFLNQTLEKEKANSFLAFYDKCLKEYHQGTDANDDGAVSRSNRIGAISTDLNEALTQKQKMVVMVRLVEYVFVASAIQNEELAFLNSICNALKVPESDYQVLFSLASSAKEFSGNQALVICAADAESQSSHKITNPQLNGEIHVAIAESANMYFIRYYGSDELSLNGISINDHKVHLFGPGAIIRGEKIDPIYYSDVEKAFVQNSSKQKIEYKVDQITYHFPGNKVGLHELSFTENGGRLVGIMGGSGAGKSTLLNVLNGNAKPSNGSVCINSTDLHKNPKALEGVVGFVSQSDLLMEDLTVYQNLFFNAELCFAQSSKATIEQKVNDTLKDLGLYEAKDLKVGNPLEKIISGGQRKRLTIALELIREPGVLFLDEPTSGLSSSDSEVILDLLKSLALKGKLIFVVIHQPSSQIFKLFDKLILLDKGGYPIYQGNPVDAIIYFKTATHRINPNISQCSCCGNVNPEQIFAIIEARLLDKNGFPTGDRRLSPKHWNTYYLEHGNEQQETIDVNEKLNSEYQKAGFFSQLMVFIKRDVLSKLNNKQYLFITLLEAPVLAILLATITLYQEPGEEYTFYANKNAVAYIFMSVIVMLFLGLMTSAEEILRDRKIRQRERFLNLSKLAYTESKILILLGISALQSFLYVMIGNSILGFEEMYLEFWLMLFAVSLFANALGLNISSAFKSAVTIYILIPFLIIPQLMLSGLLVKFDELNKHMASRSVVPIVGDVMATRWAFEGLVVNQFKNNAYEKQLYDLEKQKENLSFLYNMWVKEIGKSMKAYPTSSNQDSISQLLQNEFSKYNLNQNYITEKAINSGESARYLKAIRDNYQTDYREVVEKLDKLFGNTKDSNAIDYWKETRHAYFNDRVADLVLNNDNLSSGIYEENGYFFSSKKSIYFDPPTQYQLRAHLYAPTKHLFGKLYDTYTVNLIVILLMTLVLYITLYFEILERAIAWLGGLGRKR
jgi:ABC-type multidrug transport system ATPase subunit